MAFPIRRLSTLVPRPVGDRGPATYGKDRMDEARAIRMGWVRFLMEGQERLARLQNVDYESSTRLWGDEELHLFHSITRSDMACCGALLDDLDRAA